MRGVVVVVSALLMSVASSGCFVGNDDPQTHAADVNGISTGAAGGKAGTASASGTGNPTSATGANATNRAPTANLTAASVNGTAPLNVTFSINGTDADGDNMTWTLTFANTTIANGTAVPATANHTFADTGNFTVVLTVSDGKLNASANVTIVVTAGSAAASGPAPVETPYATMNPDGTCDAKGERAIGPLYLHDRPSAAPQPGFTAGDGTWVYEETNKLPGLQIGGPDESATYKACLNPDHLIF